MVVSVFFAIFGQRDHYVIWITYVKTLISTLNVRDTPECIFKSPEGDYPRLTLRLNKTQEHSETSQDTICCQAGGSGLHRSRTADLHVKSSFNFHVRIHHHSEIFVCHHINREHKPETRLPIHVEHLCYLKFTHKKGHGGPSMYCNVLSCAVLYCPVQ